MRKLFFCLFSIFVFLFIFKFASNHNIVYADQCSVILDEQTCNSTNGCIPQFDQSDQFTNCVVDNNSTAPSGCIFNGCTGGQYCVGSNPGTCVAAGSGSLGSPCIDIHTGQTASAVCGFNQCDSVSGECVVDNSTGSCGFGETPCANNNRSCCPDSTPYICFDSNGNWIGNVANEPACEQKFPASSTTTTVPAPAGTSGNACTPPGATKTGFHCCEDSRGNYWSSNTYNCDGSLVNGGSSATITTTQGNPVTAPSSGNVVQPQSSPATTTTGGNGGGGNATTSTNAPPGTTGADPTTGNPVNASGCPVGWTLNPNNNECWQCPSGYALNFTTNLCDPQSSTTTSSSGETATGIGSGKSCDPNNQSSCQSGVCIQNASGGVSVPTNTAQIPQSLINTLDTNRVNSPITLTPTPTITGYSFPTFCFNSSNPSVISNPELSHALGDSTACALSPSVLPSTYSTSSQCPGPNFYFDSATNKCQTFSLCPPGTTETSINYNNFQELCVVGQQQECPPSYHVGSLAGFGDVCELNSSSNVCDPGFSFSSLGYCTQNSFVQLCPTGMHQNGSNACVWNDVPGCGQNQGWNGTACVNNT